MSTATDIQPINSFSYGDAAGLNLGLVRLPGENNAAFAERLYRAAASQRDATYAGILNEIALQFGLATSAAIRFTSDGPLTTLAVRGGRIEVYSAGQSYRFPLARVAEDSMLEWRRLAEIVDDLASVPGCTATLLGADAPALVLARQSNVLLQTGEPVATLSTRLSRARVIPGSERFNQVVPAYTIREDGTLHFNSMAPAGTEVSYQYCLLPYELVASEVALFSLAGHDLNALLTDGLPYQVCEAIDRLLARDRSYWGS